MSQDDVLLRRIGREIRARKAAEEIGEKKIAELYRANCRLEIMLEKQKKDRKKLKKRAHELEVEIANVEEARYAKNVLQNIFESSIEYSIVATNLQGQIVLWNEGAQYNYGYLAQEVMNKKNIRILSLPEDIESGLVQQFLEIAAQNGKADGVFERVRKDHSRFIDSVSLSLRHDDNGKPIGYVYVSKNITEEKLLQEKIIKSNQELTEFAYIVSHDLKAPLRAIDRLSHWIIDDCANKLDDHSKENLAVLRQRVNRMSNLIDGILQYSRAGRVDLDLSMVDTKELLREVIDALNPGKKFKIRYAKNLPCFYTCRIPLSQVFSNLISNSIKHHHLEKGIIEISVRDLGDFYRFSVLDDGPGIGPEYYEKIFEIFQTLQSKDILESTGIGLSIVKKIVESLGGKITVESCDGKGALFHFTWPKYSKS